MDTPTETVLKAVDRIRELETELAEAQEAIKRFAYSQRWAHETWKDQPAIKPLFDIAEALAGEEK